MAELDGSQIVYDLYCGTGTIANYVAGKSKKVIGVEQLPEAIEDAKENAINNGIKNTEFYAGDLKDTLDEDFVKKVGHPDLIIVDPPRNGLHKDVVGELNRLKAKQVIYVSCNSATQARDLELLNETYKITALQAIDLFPHTVHVENVALLILRS